MVGKPPLAPKRSTFQVAKAEEEAPRHAPPIYVAQGTYGCVMKPALSCKGDGSTLPHAISKIFGDEKYQQEEVQFQNMIAKLDPRGEYTVKKLDECKVGASMFPPTELAKCRNLDSASPHFWQIIYEYGGDDLHRMMKSKDATTFEELFMSFGNVIKGLIKLKDNHMVHQDIKPQNILYSKGGHRCYLIDFGLLTPCKKIYEDENEFVFGYDYDFYPPEYKLYHAMALAADQFDMATVKRNAMYIQDIYSEQQALPDSLRDFVSHVMSNYMVFHNRCLTGKAMHFDRHYSSAVAAASSLVSFWSPKNMQDIQSLVMDAFSHTSSLARWLTRFTDKIDVYMMGITLLEMFMRLHDQGRVNISKDAFVVDFFRLVHGMIRFDPAKRYSAKQAWSHYQRVISKMTLVDQKSKWRIKDTFQVDEPKIQSASRGTKTKPHTTFQKSAPTQYSRFIKKQMSLIRTLRNKQRQNST